MAFSKVGSGSGKILFRSASTLEEIWPKNYLGQNPATDPEQDPEPNLQMELDLDTEPKPNPKPDLDIFKCRI
jgi:hypothetical protein